MTGNFDNDDSDVTTHLIPTPGGRGRVPPSSAGMRQPSPRGGASFAGTPVDLPVWGGNPRSPLLAPAAPLLALATRVQTMAEQPDVDALRQRIIEAMHGFERQGRSAGVDPKVLNVGHYALCVFIDEMVQRTPWGQSSGWAQKSIASSFHGNVIGGNEFFVWLKKLQQNPGQYGAVLELMYLCLSLGFEGQTRVRYRGRAEHASIRDSVYATIRELRGNYERDLSPHWRGITAVHRTLAASVPLWVWGAVAAALLVLLYVGLDFVILRGESSALAAQLATLPPQAGPLNLTVAAPPAQRGGLAPPSPPPKPHDDKFDHYVGSMTRFLQPEIDGHLVDVLATAQGMTIRLVGDAMFDSGSAEVKPAFVTTLERIAVELNGESGNLLVTGHTDNTPIRRTLRFPSNYDLSVARAEAVGAILRAKLAQPDRISTQGLAENRPIAPNGTPEGRSKNRRVELVLLKAEGTAP